ncbi:uncharacterized protein [Cicer arietinum]|uniref:Beta-mannosyltransferase 1-like n=1 Tax=Cicer arietinum TaxID=3827 RepID=A0A1S3EKR5_CICAR|nr:beta-mannosyltransferase 1-like [Cicer arietinum]
MLKIKAFNLCFLCALFLLSVVATETSKEGYAKDSKKNVLVDKLDGGRKPVDRQPFDPNKPVGSGNKTREERSSAKEVKQRAKEAKEAKQKANEAKQKANEAKQKENEAKEAKQKANKANEAKQKANEAKRKEKEAK